MMKFIKLRHGKDEKRTYTVRIDSIACIETYIDNSGKLYTWITSKDFEDGQLYVKETEEEILKTLEYHERMKQLSKLLK